MTSKREGKQDGPRRALKFGGLLALGIALGIGGGVTSSPDPVQAQDDAFCEQDECERYEYRSWWRPWRVEVRGRCEDNTPNKTGCDMTSEDQCRTYSCAEPPGGGGGGGSGGGGDDDEDDGDADDVLG